MPPRGAAPRPQLRVVLAAGGTGGHIFPALAIAEAVALLAPDTRIAFVGSSDRMEGEIVPKYGYAFHGVDAVSLVRRPLLCLENLLIPFRLCKALAQALLLMWQLKPDCVVGTGGYVSVPTCLAAWLCRTPVVLQEQNAYAGLSNRMLGRIAAVVYIAFIEAQQYFPRGRCLLCGNPTRSALEQPMGKKEALQRLHVTQGGSRSLVLGVLGGSLGAGAINEAMLGVSDELLERHDHLVIIWQTGQAYFEEMSRRVGARGGGELAATATAAHGDGEGEGDGDGDSDSGILRRAQRREERRRRARRRRLFVMPFIRGMESFYAAADLVVARAGAITCTELLQTRTPSILIPSPNVAEDHQRKNAHAMARLGAAHVLDEAELDAAALGAAVGRLLAHHETRREMAQRMRRVHGGAQRGAAHTIATGVLQRAYQHATRRAS